MIGHLDPAYKEATVVGGGIAGLLMAERLDREGWEVTLIEAADGAGGLISTHQARLGIAEAAAHSIQATPAVLELCGRLGVELVAVQPESRARYVWRAGKLRRFPLSIGEAFRALGRAYFVLADRNDRPEQLSLEQWGARHLGQSALKYLLTPFVRGIYGARTSEIRVGMAFPGLIVPHGHSLLSWAFRRWHLKLRGKAGPGKSGRPRMMAPAQGMAALTQALETRLRERLGDRFRCGERIGALPPVKNLVLCVPPTEAASLLSVEAPILSRALDEVRYAPLLSITAFTEREAFPSPPRGVGVLLPEGTSRKALGILFNSSSFSGRVEDSGKWVSLTIMMGGTSKPEVLQGTDAQIGGWVREELQEILDLAPGAHIETVIHRWERAIPLYGDQLRAAWEAAGNGWCSQPGRVLFGNYTGQVSIRGMIETVSTLKLSEPHAI